MEPTARSSYNHSQFYYDIHTQRMTEIPADRIIEANFINNNSKKNMATEPTPVQFAEAKDLTRSEALLREMGLKDANGKYTTTYNDLRRYTENKAFEYQAIALAEEMKEARKLEIKKDESVA